MAGFKASSTGAKAALLVGGTSIAVLVGYGGWIFNRQVPVTLLTPDAQPSAVASQVASAPDAPAIPTIKAAPDAAAVPVVPSFDVVRIEPDGSAVVAGKAEPGSKIILRIDGVETSATTADANGNFVGLFLLDSSQQPRILTMTSLLSDQSEIAAAAEVALAPTQTPAIEAPVVVATAAAPAPNTAPEIASPTETADATVAAEVMPQAQSNTEATSVSKAPAALLVTKEGVSVLQPGASSAEDASGEGLAIDTISYTPAGEVQLAGRAAPGSFLRIYLDNAPIIDIKVGDDGRWASTMPAITPGIYTLRADQLAQDGTVTARFETPFKRETQAALAAAAQPPEQAVDVASADPQAPALTSDLAPTVDAATVAAPEPKSDTPQIAVTAKAAEDGSVSATDSRPAVEVSAGDAVIAAASPQPVAPVSITVQPGFTLWGIASQQFGDGVMYVQVFEANKDKIRDPDLIYPGQVFVIPKAAD